MATELNDPTIIQDVPCTTCGYDLRGLQPDGKCPECGSMIDRSLRSWNQVHIAPGLWQSDPHWLREIHWGLILNLLGFLVMIFSVVITRTQLQYSWPDRWRLYLICTGWTLAHWGIWKMTAREPRAPAGPPHGKIRWAGMAVIVSVLVPGWFYLSWFVYVNWYANWHLHIRSWPHWIGIVSAVATIGCTVQVLGRIRDLAQRERLRCFSRLGSVLIYLLPASYLAAAIIVMVNWRLNSDVNSLNGMALLPTPALGFAITGMYWIAVLRTAELLWRTEAAIFLPLTLVQLGALAMTLSGLVLVHKARWQQRRIRLRATSTE